MNKYEKQAQDFLNKTETTFKAEFVKHDKYFDDDTQSRDIYLCALARGERVKIFKFGQSIDGSGWQFWVKPNPHNKITVSGELTKEQAKRKALERYGNLHGIESKPPEPVTAYDLLSCLQKYPVESFEDFCAEFGYNTDSRKAEKLYSATCEEYAKVEALFNDKEMEELRKIQ